MRFNLYLIIAGIAMLTCLGVTAQESATTPATDKNFFKINLTGIALKNYSAQYERVLNKTISIAVAYRHMPTGSLPFRNEIEKAVAEDGDQEAIDAVHNLKIGNYAITPEVRFYVGKRGYGRGFYIAPFYRYARFEANNVNVEYDENPVTRSSLGLSGNFTSNTGGLMFGAQWALGKHIALDWWIFGPHYGSASGNFAGASSRPLTPMEQQVLKENLEDLDIPLTKKTVSVNANGAVMKLDGPWAGVRGAICIGVKF